LAAQVRSWGGFPTRYSIVPDRFEEIVEVVQQAALENDLILLNAGSSAGSEDFSASVIQHLGQLLIHGVAIRPGHPVILGLIQRKSNKEKNLSVETIHTHTPIIGVPGYPVSSALTGEVFVRRLIRRWLGQVGDPQQQITAKLTRKITSPAGDTDYIRVAVGKVGTNLLAAPLSRGAGVITSLVKADGVVILPQGTQGLPAGAEVIVQLFRSPQEIEQTIFCIGSHDLTLDLLAQKLAIQQRRLTSANVGSLAGLIALQRGEAHCAGSHLLDPETGEYNICYVKDYLKDIPVVIIALVNRTQGLLVRKGNPKNIRQIQDLNRPDIRFVNRQRGAGTRVLLDYHLGLLGIESASIQGYDHEEYTHLAVAASIASGRADCGLGVIAAAQAVDLDFIPLFQERYDLVIPNSYAKSELLFPLLQILEDRSFQQQVAKLPGYDASIMGKVMYDSSQNQQLTGKD
jgi:putative molybdopterin biosynthesis protein